VIGRCVQMTSVARKGWSYWVGRLSLVRCTKYGAADVGWWRVGMRVCGFMMVGGVGAGLSVGLGGGVR